MNLPTYNLLYFKNLLDIAFIKFFQTYNDSFIKNQNDQTYLLVEDLSLSKIESFLYQTIDSLLTEIIEPYDIIKSPKIYFIVESCFPKDNIILNFKQKNFPQNLYKFINSFPTIKYILREKDIKINLIKFNEACFNVFNSFFKEQLQCKKYRNLIFISNKKLDCYYIFKIIEDIFGKINCKKLYNEKISSDNSSLIESPIISINDTVSKYIFEKSKISSTIEFRKNYEELQQFLQLRLDGIR